MPYRIEFDAVNRILRSSFTESSDDQEFRIYFADARTCMRKVQPVAAIIDLSHVAGSDVGTHAITEMARVIVQFVENDSYRGSAFRPAVLRTAKCFAFRRCVSGAKARRFPTVMIWLKPYPDTNLYLYCTPSDYRWSLQHYTAGIYAFP